MLYSDFCCSKVNDFILITLDHEASVSMTVSSNTIRGAKDRIVVIDLDISYRIAFTKDTSVEVCVGDFRRTYFLKVKEICVDSLISIQQFGRSDTGFGNIIQKNVRIRLTNQTLKEQTIEGRTSGQFLCIDNIVSDWIAIRSKYSNPCSKFRTVRVNNVLQTEVKYTCLILSSTRCLRHHNVISCSAIFIQVDSIDLCSWVTTRTVGANQSLIKLIQVILSQNFLTCDQCTESKSTNVNSFVILERSTDSINNIKSVATGCKNCCNCITISTTNLISNLREDTRNIAQCESSDR